MSVIGAMSGVLDLETQAWSAGAQRAIRDVDGVQSKFRSFIADTKQDFGKNSALGQSLKLLAGGGAIAGISMALGELNKATSEAAKLADEFRAGKVSAGQMAEQIAVSIPVLGQAWSIGRNIREIITGEEASQKKVNDQIQKRLDLQNASLKLNREFADETAKVLDVLAGVGEKASREVIQASPDEFHRKWAAEEDAFNDQLQAVRTDANKAIHQDTIDNLSAERNRLQTGKASSAGNDRIAQIDLELGRLNADKLKIVAAELDAEAALQRAHDAKIGAMNDAATQETLDKQQAATIQAAKETAEATAKINRQQLDDLEEQRKNILASVTEESYRSANATSRRGSTFAIYTPHMASKMEQLSAQQAKSLISIDAKIGVLKASSVATF